MAINTRNKRRLDFSTASMSDLVFLLLIFFMITSTLVSPNAVKLLLPDSKSKTMARQTVTVYIDDKFQYQVDANKNGRPIVADLNVLSEFISSSLNGQPEDASVVLRCDKTVPVQYIVNVFDIVNELNSQTGNKFKVILATKPANP
ncbi:MAG: biopolymer transporter ExbD [Bacteroidales bacterium]|jgi:biopolymer transport protein ExbD|nr:biopolymer transporter ExbD [Bacteroidales bacterium]MDD3664678.1 biopolymer transporter ExbD [Bacteroidales bacterium]